MAHAVITRDWGGGKGWITLANEGSVVENLALAVQCSSFILELHRRLNPRTDVAHRADREGPAYLAGIESDSESGFLAGESGGHESALPSLP
jgi:hypothetical protein